MPASVVDIDIADGIPDAADLEPYSQAFVVLRYRGVPFGHTWLPVTSGYLPASAIWSLVTGRLLPEFSRRWTEANLGTTAPDRHLPSATIAICTRDRPQDLARALAAVTRAAAGRHAILVVDNAPSSNASRDVVAAHTGVEYVVELRPGLNAARNRAMHIARTDVVAFTDDDAAPEPGWIEALLRNFDHRLVLGVTGLTLPLELRSEAQEWFERYSPFGRGYFRRVFDASETSPHAAGAIGAGANMAIRRDVLALAGPFDESLDAGTPTRSGGDHEMFARILTRGYRMVYEPAAVSWHRHRTSWDELRNTIEGYGTGVYALWTSKLLGESDFGVIKEAARWFFGHQLPSLARAVTRQTGAAPLDLVLAELGGCAKGPFAWLRSRRRRPGTAIP